jgi:putative Mn2+ efflux pump MntP
MSSLDFLSVILIALGLSADCFAVAISAGLSKIHLSYLQQFRVSLSFGAFQALMAYIGWREELLLTLFQNMTTG